MRGAPRGRWSRFFAMVAMLALVAGCSAKVAGSPTAAPIPPLTAAESVAQSLLNFGEAGAVHYKGTLTTAADEKLAFDITVSMVGEVLGSITVDGAAASVLVLNKTLYLKAPATFWAALNGLGGGDGKGTAIADRWVKLPPVLLGVEFGEIFTPDALSQHLLKNPKAAGDGPLTERPKTAEGGVEVIKVPVESGSAYLSAEQPHGVVKLDLSSVGNTDNTKVSGLLTEVADVSVDTGAFYQELAKQAADLTTAIDALTTVEQGAHRFENCAEQSCSLVVEFKNTAKVPVRVHVKADWTGDNAPLGVCEAQVGPVAPGAPGTATCTLSSPQWVQFWQKAHSVVGIHPYGASWAPLVLADAPDLTSVTTRASAKPADPNAKKTDGDAFVYAIGYGDKIWKYGVVSSKYWQDRAKEQLRTCLATNQAACSVSLVTAADDAVSGYGLQKQLVETYAAQRKTCPTGQWVSCKR
jgi:hypothetical protein